MKIKQKALIFFLVCGLMCILMISTFFQLIVSRYVVRLENEDVKSIFSKADSVFKREEKGLNSTLEDWSHWDDNYHFMGGIQKEVFIENNLNTLTLKQLGLNMMLFVSPKGQLYESLSSSDSSSIVHKTLLALSAVDGNRKSVLEASKTKDKISGLLSLDGKILLLAAGPITKSDGSGINGGSLVIGKLVDKKLLDYTSDITNSYFKLFSRALGMRDAVVIHRGSKSLIAERGLTDIQGNRTLTAQILFQRRDKKNSEVYLRVLEIAVVVFNLILALFSFAVSDKMLLKRLRLLKQFIEEVGVSRDISSRIQLPGHDEINSICSSTNNMLNVLSDAYGDVLKTEERFRIIMEATNDGYIDYNLATKEFYISPQWKRYIGYGEGQADFDLFVEFIRKIHPDSIGSFRESFAPFLNGTIDYIEIEFCMLKKNNESIWVLLRGKAAEKDKEGNPLRMVATLLEITARKHYEAQILDMGLTDKLTGLRNRTYVEQRMEELQKASRAYSILMGDVNGLKLVNDTFGHKRGDEFIQTIAEIMKTCSSDGDIVARWGGDEYVILLPDKTDAYMYELSNNIKKLCAGNKEFGFNVSIAIGCAGRGEGRDSDAKMNLAEERMYRAKLTEKNSSRNATIVSLEKTLYEKHSETEEHTQRIKAMAVVLGRRLGLTSDQLSELELLSLLHDIGKIGIPESILMKRGKLTKEEWETMKTHTEIGYRIAKATMGLSHVAEEILSHHERYDGSGYPRGLSGEDIPILSRIINIIDSYDVMTHSRTYKEAFSKDYAIEELKRCSGTQFDPRLVEIFLSLLEENVPEEEGISDGGILGIITDCP